MKKYLVLISLLLLNSCFMIHEKLNNDGDKEFSDHLARGYKSFADSESEQYDWVDSSHFYKKAQAAIDGNEIEPEYPKDWQIDEDKIAELEYARRKLSEVLTTNFKREEPHIAARLQISYDCWVEQQEEAWQKDHINACKDEFLGLITKYTTYGWDPMKMHYAKFDANNDYVIYFDTNEDLPNIAGQNIMKYIVEKFKDSNNYEIVIEGHTDTVDNKAFNLNLSIRRADNVKRYLVNSGISEDLIGVEAYGESRLAAPTADNVDEELNRRVLVLIYNKKD